jgi:hypothetical protein
MAKYKYTKSLNPLYNKYATFLLGFVITYILFKLVS